MEKCYYLSQFHASAFPYITQIPQSVLRFPPLRNSILLEEMTPYHDRRSIHFPLESRLSEDLVGQLRSGHKGLNLERGVARGVTQTAMLNLPESFFSARSMLEFSSLPSACIQILLVRKFSFFYPKSCCSDDLCTDKQNYACITAVLASQLSAQTCSAILLPIA